MDLFEQHQRERVEAEAPLAFRMRPRTLDEFVGQGHIIGPGRLLRRAIQIDQLSSLIFYGPPGTGKTTLARIIAGTTRAHFIAINAVLAGIKEIRSAIEVAQERRGQYGERTILFVDEVHRFNKSQQDGLLPWVENGTITLIGATTENPYFEVNKALVSRSRLFQLKLLERTDLLAVARQALEDPVRGYGKRPVRLEAAALDHLVDVAGGDARTLLNALELAVETTEPNAAGEIPITLAVAEESIQRRAVLYDREGDAHFDTVSAYIKSLRGSDPDAALYWLARMLYAGEDPRFIFRRLLIQASEDVGLADPQALGVVIACAAAFDRVGLPEGRYHLAQATLYLATAPKSNSAMAFFDALAAVEREQASDPPNHLKDASRDKEGFGHGAGYLYPHAYRDHWVAQQYLPANLQGQVFFQPSNEGFEAQIKIGVERRREAQLAAIAEQDDREVLTFSPIDKAADRWLQRTLSRLGEQLGDLRERVFALARPARHHVALDLFSANGLFTWEALRQCPEGSVYTATRTATEAAAIREQAGALPELLRPIVFVTAPGNLTEVVREVGGDVRFERIVGRNLLRQVLDKTAVIAGLLPLLAPAGVVVLAESVPRRAQRLYRLLESAWLGGELYGRIEAAEEAAYTEDPQLQPDAEDLQAAFEAAGFKAQVTIERQHSELRLTAALLERWFIGGIYQDQLARLLEPAEIKAVQRVFEERLLNRVVGWQSTVALVQAFPREGH